LIFFSLRKGYATKMSFSLKFELKDFHSESLVHRFRNFGEAVYVELQEICSINIQEIDVATTSIDIREIKRKNIGEVTRRVKNLLNKHGFLESAILTRTKTA